MHLEALVRRLALRVAIRERLERGGTPIARLSDGSRKVVGISEVTGVEGEVICMQEIFLFERYGIDENGKVRGVFRASGIRPKCSDRLATAGCRLRPALFESRMEV